MFQISKMLYVYEYWQTIGLLFKLYSYAYVRRRVYTNVDALGRWMEVASHSKKDEVAMDVDPLVEI